MTVDPVESEPVKREAVKPKHPRPSAWALLTVLPVVLLGCMLTACCLYLVR